MSDENRSDALAVAATQFDYRSRLDTILGSAFVVLFPVDPRRWALMFQNNGPDNALISFEPIGSNPAQVIVIPGNLPTILTFRDLGPLIQQSPVVIAPGGTAVLNSWSIFKNG